MLNDDDFRKESAEWLAEQFGALTDTVTTVSPSEWAEENRYLPSSVTPMPGYYRYDICPPMREIVDCMDIRSSVREVTVKKGAQIGATVGILENTIGYIIDEVRSAPAMMLTADKELAKLRMESYITPMIDQSGLAERIRSHDDTNKRKTGRTDAKLEWDGGGFLVPFGAQNAAKLRSLSIQYLLEDETDGFPPVVGKDGKPNKLAEARTKAYHQTRKILRLSTPSIKGRSVIDENFKRGDQRQCHLPCKNCGEYQVMRFQGVHKETGEQYGLVWVTTEDGRLKTDSVRYVCKFCSHPHINADKTWMLERYRWVPTAPPAEPGLRSYHYPALLAASSLYPWSAIVRNYLEAWDDEENRPRDMELLKEFYNNDLGEVFETRGDRVRFASVSSHRRADYSLSEVPNTFAMEHADGPIGLLTCAIDVHKNNLAVSVFGWSRGARAFLVDYWRFRGDCEQLDNPETWGKARDVIENSCYIADDGKRYGISLTFVDASWNGDLANRFCNEYETAVFPIRGRDLPVKGSTVKEFSQYTTTMGTPAFRVTVDLYKDRWSAALRRQWDGYSTQPPGYFNAPVDLADQALKELTVEYKREKLEKGTNRVVGYEWYRPSGAANELWDLLIYNTAALEVLAWDACTNTLGLDNVNWAEFWAWVESEAPYFDAGR